MLRPTRLFNCLMVGTMRKGSYPIAGFSVVRSFSSSSTSTPTTQQKIALDTSTSNTESNSNQSSDAINTSSESDTASNNHISKFKAMNSGKHQSHSRLKQRNDDSNIGGVRYINIQKRHQLEKHGKFDLEIEYYGSSLSEGVPLESNLYDLDNLNYYFFNACNEVQFGKRSLDSLRNDPIFVQNCEQLHAALKGQKTAHKISNDRKMNILKSLESAGLDGEFPLVRSLCHDLNWQAKLLPLEKVLDLLTFQMRFQQTEIQQTLKLLISCVQKQIDNLANARNIDWFIDFYKASNFLSHVFDKAMLLKVDEILQNWLQTQSYPPNKQQVCKLLTTIADGKRRPTPLIKLLAYELRNDNLALLEPQLLCKLISALATMNFPDLNILSAACYQLQQKDFIRGLAHKDTEWLLKCLTRLRFKPSEIISSLDMHFRIQPSVTQSLFFEFLIATARLNYKLEQFPELLKAQRWFDETQVSRVPDDFQYLKVMWSLAFHDALTENMASRLFTPEFMAKLQREQLANSYVKRTYANLHAYCRKVLKMNIQTPTELDVDAPIKDETLVKTIQEDLNTIILSKHMLTNFKADLGTFFDFGFVCNKKLKPVHVEDVKTLMEFLPSMDKSEKALHAICVLTHNYKDVILNTLEPTGDVQMILNLSKHYGFTLLNFSAINYNTKLAAVNRVRYLREILSNAIN